MSQGNLELGLRPKVGVGDAHVMVSAQLEQSLSILVHFTHAELSKAGGPRVVICAHSGIEVAQENNLFIVGDAADDGCEVLVLRTRLLYPMLRTL